MKQTKRTRAALKRAVKLLGGISATAREVDRSRQQVWQWVHGSKSPAPRLAHKIAAATGHAVRFDELRPDVNQDWGR